jgi:hypothetical protein
LVVACDKAGGGLQYCILHHHFQCFFLVNA